MKKIFLSAILVLLSLGVFAEDVPDWEEVLQTLDFRSNFTDTDFSSTMTMIREDPEEGISKSVVSMFRRDREDKFLMLTLEPNNRKGQGTLRSGDNMWFYDPESRQFSHTSLKENYGETDAKNSDFRGKTLAEDYNVVSHSQGKLGSFDVWILELESENDEVAYPFEKMWIDKKSMLLLKTEDYSLSKRLLRISYYPNYARVGEVYAPVKMIFVDALVEGKKTQISISDISIETLPDSVFTKAYVERVNK